MKSIKRQIGERIRAHLNSIKERQNKDKDNKKSKKHDEESKIGGTTNKTDPNPEFDDIPSIDQSQSSNMISKIDLIPTPNSPPKTPPLLNRNFQSKNLGEEKKIDDRLARIERSLVQLVQS